ncbi:MAG: tetratricopeptide repeat protein [Alphaproteobacteria bacterium]
MSNIKNTTPTLSVAKEASALPEAERQEFQDQIDSLQLQLSKMQATKTEAETVSVSVSDITGIYDKHLNSIDLMFEVTAFVIVIIGGLFTWIGFQSIRGMIEKGVTDQIKVATDKLIAEAIDPLKDQYEAIKEEYDQLIEKQKTLDATLDERNQSIEAEFAEQSKRIEIEHYMTLAQNYYSVKKWVDAIKNYDEVIKRDSDNLVAYFNRGIANGKIEEYDASIADYDEVIRIFPKDAYAYNNRGLSKHNLDDYKAAIEDYDVAIGLAPRNDAPYYNKSCAYALMGKPVEEILELLKKAIGLNDKNIEMAREDDDFVSLRENKEFRKLVGLPEKK